MFIYYSLYISRIRTTFFFCSVAAYVHDSFQIKVVSKSKMHNLSETELKIMHKVSKVSALIIIVYRPPTSRNSRKV